MIRHDWLNQCRNKVQHHSKHAAQAAKRSVKRKPSCRHPEALCVYKCPHCGWYHVGTNAYLVGKDDAA